MFGQLNRAGDPMLTSVEHAHCESGTKGRIQHRICKRRSKAATGRANGARTQEHIGKLVEAGAVNRSVFARYGVRN